MLFSIKKKQKERTPYACIDPWSGGYCHRDRCIAPIFKPLGFGDWRISTALITGFIAKESVVSTLTVLVGDGITSLLTVGAAAPLLVFCLLYTPCVAAIASVRRELGGKWALSMMAMQCGIAWICACLMRTVLLLAGVA